MKYRSTATYGKGRFRFGIGLTTSALVGFSLPSEASTIIDDHFDDATVTGWVSQGNIRTFSAHNITESGSVLTSEVVATQTNTHRGIVSTTTFDPDSEAGGFSMHFTVDSVQGAPGANGFFIGGVNNDSTFFRDVSLDNFGLTFFGQNARTGSLAGFGLAYGDNNGASAADFILGNSDSQGDVQLASFADGFAADLTADPTGWTYSITGLNTAAGTPATFSGSGSWAAAGTDFATLFGGDDSWHAMGSLQHVPAATHTIGFDRIAVSTIPEPSGALLMLIGAGAMAFRRRRS